jgi:hypothetical protein
MKSNHSGLTLAVREHLASNQPLTRLEAIVLYGVPDLTKIISDMRRQGWLIQRRTVPYARAVKRIQKYAHLQPPKNLPVREIQITEYWINA